MKQQPIRFERERRYPLSVSEAWRILADTDHLNRTIGLPAVEFSERDESLLRHARARAYGMVPLRWKEYPFAWVRERRYAVRREFESGPMACAEVGIELAPDASGVIVKAFADFTPSKLAGRFLWQLGKAPVNDVLAYCDQYLARKASGKADPVPVPQTRATVDRARLDRLLDELARSPVRHDLIPRLRERILEGSDDQLVRIRPFALADAWGADRLEVLRLLLHATRAGLFELRWELMCPACRVPKAEVDSLARLPIQFHCETCGIAYDADFDERVELRFSVHPAVRAASDDVYCVGGPLRMPHIVAQQYLRPHEDRRIDLTPAGPLVLRAVGAAHRLTIVPGAPQARVGDVRVTYAGGRWVGPHSLVRDDGLGLPDGAALWLRNQTEGPVLAVLEEVGWTSDATPAARVATLQEFRDLFSSEVLAPDQQVAVRHIALLFSDLQGSTRLYEGIGDAAAYSRVNRHFEFIRRGVTQGAGSIVKTLGDGVMCAFLRAEDAIAAALAMQEQVTSWCRDEEIDPPLVLKIGVHAGPAIAMTANGRLDYFGRTVNVAARLGGQSRGGDVVMLRDVFEATALALRDRLTVEPFTTELRGLEGERELVRVAIRDHVAPRLAPRAAPADRPV
jgi:adenylate cyclase